MKNLLIIFVFIFVINCSSNEDKYNKKTNYIEIDSSKEYSFEEYTSLLLKNNNSKGLPNINNIPD